MNKRTEYKNMTPIDLKKLGAKPFSEMDARATVTPEHQGYIEIIIPIFEQDAIRVVRYYFNNCYRIFHISVFSLSSHNQK